MTHKCFSPLLIYASKREVLENLRAVKTLAEEPAIPAQGIAAEPCLGSPAAVYRRVTAFPTVKTRNHPLSVNRTEKYVAYSHNQNHEE